MGLTFKTYFLLVSRLAIKACHQASIMAAKTINWYTKMLKTSKQASASSRQ